MSKSPPPSPLFFTVTDSSAEIWYEEMHACILRFHLMVEGSTNAWKHPEWIEWFGGVFTPPVRAKTKYEPAKYEYAVHVFDHMRQFVQDNFIAINEDDEMFFCGHGQDMLKKYVDQVLSGVFGLWVNHMLTGNYPNARDVAMLVSSIDKDFI